jgi:adenylate cyclase
MSIKRLLVLFLLVTVVLAVLITSIAFKLRTDFSEVKMAQDRRFQSYVLAEELLSSSELLTRFARTYAATGEERFVKYFQQVLDIRNGKQPRPLNYGGVYWDLEVAGQVNKFSNADYGPVSLEQRMLDAGITLKEFSLLKDAQSRSDLLVKLEDEAMGLVKLAYSGTEPGKEAMKRKAIDILHGNEYHLAKASIMEPIGEFLVLLDERTRVQLQDLNANSRQMLVLLLGLSALMILSLAGFILLLRKKLLIRGTALVEKVNMIAAGNLSVRVDDKGKDEVGELAKAIDSMAIKLEMALADAKDRTLLAETQSKELEIQGAHSEKLLNNILPVLIVDRLKKGESSIAETFPEVTVLFADIVGFTEMSTQLGPRQLVSMLNDVFGRFDELAQEFNLEKIKTIGDCYMVVGGVPDRSPTHCQQVARFALAALKSIDDYSIESGQKLRIRIGMHTGTVVAGIVGKQKYSYDLWGDVVNTASRMEGASLPNHIHVTESVHLRLADDFIFESRGMVELKGKGSFNTYFLKGNRFHD